MPLVVTKATAKGIYLYTPKYEKVNYNNLLVVKMITIILYSNVLRLII